MASVRHIVGKLLEPVVGYTRIVLLTKHGLFVLAALIVVWLLVLPLMKPVHERFHLTFSKIDSDEFEKPKMLNPHFQGVDGKNQTFNVTADAATQKNDNEVVLKNVNGDISLAGGGWVSVLAKDGLMNSETSVLELYNDVMMFTDDGYEFKTQYAKVHTANDVIEGDQELQGQGPMGVLNSGGFRIENMGKKLLFNKRVKLVVYPNSE